MDSTASNQGTHWWAVAATYPYATTQNDQNLTGHLALVPCSISGEPDGPPYVVRVPTIRRQVDQLRLVGALCAHTLGRRDGEGQPVAVMRVSRLDWKPERALDSLSTSIRLRHDTRKYDPALVGLMAELGREADYVWISLVSAPAPALLQAYRLAEVAAGRSPGAISPDDAHLLPLDDVLRMAREI
ncbi:hypothetical protein [Streptomyces griseoaurantiacus]|uniref:hypothetical protein n=1 Tax=Streptomyces griseoaurantiacus TaxID=68213 RepID=UPI0036A58876